MERDCRTAGFWATNAPEFYLLLVEERGWPPEQFEAWLAELWTRLLLP